MSSQERVERWEQFEQQLYVLLPYPLLLVSLLVAIFDLRAHPAARAVAIGLSVLTAVWCWLGSPPWPREQEWAGPRPGSTWAVIQMVGRLLLAGALVQLSGWFGIFAFSNYMYVYRLLVGRWRRVGVVANALVVAASYTQGVPRDRDRLLVFLALFVVIALLASAFAHFGWAASEQTARHRRVIAELGESNRRLEAALEENAGLHAQLLVQAREAGALDERARMAREIHDTLAQGLAGIIAQLQAAAHGRGRDQVWHRHVERANQLARDSLTEARRSVAGLAPRQLSEGRLPVAIADAAQHWSEGSGVPVTMQTTGDARPLVADTELALFRVSQEALTNVAKHARAGRVGLTLSYMDDVVTLDIRDDGVGFDPAQRPANDGRSGYGLTGMRQRLARVAGTLTVESAPGEGTAISANVPAVGTTADTPTDAPTGTGLAAAE